MSDTNVIIEGMAFTVLLLAASAMVILHIRMYMDWKEHKEFKKRHEAFVKQLQKDLQEEVKRREAGNS